MNERICVSWHYLQGQAEVSSAAISWDGKQFVPSKSTTTLGAYCLQDNETESCRRSRYGTTLKLLMDTLGAGDVILFPAGSRVKTFLSQEKALELLEADPVSGRKWRESLAKYDRVSRSWKTSRRLLDGDLEKFSETWPGWGTMRGGVCWELMTPERPTGENESGYWLTPCRAAEAPNRGSNKKSGPKGLLEAAKNGSPKWWPTPQAHDVTTRGNTEADHHYYPHDLSNAVKMWPTPRKCDGEKGTRSPAGHAKERERRKNGTDLPTAVMFPTPTEQDAKNNGSASQEERNSLPLNAVVGGKLSPLFVEWLMDFPLGWTGLRPLGTRRLQAWRRSHLLFYRRD
jgi:hypothetical protein